MEEQTIPSDAPSEYMRGYSDGVEWARQQEREECAKVCNEQGQGRYALQHYAALTYVGATSDCAAAIRARGQS